MSTTTSAEVRTYSEGVAAKQLGMPRPTLSKHRSQGLLNPELRIQEPFPTTRSPRRYDADQIDAIVAGKMALYAAPEPKAE